MLKVSSTKVHVLEVHKAIQKLNMNTGLDEVRSGILDLQGGWGGGTMTVLPLKSQ